MSDVRPYDDAGCCTQAAGVVTFMPAATQRYPRDPSQPCWCIVSDLGCWPINFCPFCGKAAAHIRPKRASRPDDESA